LKKFLASSHPLVRDKALQELAKVLQSPQQLSESPLLTDSHILKQEALIISDCLEAVTNGMHEDEVLSSLEILPQDSVFTPWKHFVMALYAFYHNNSKGMVESIQMIDPQSPPGRLIPLLQALATETNTPRNLSHKEREAWESIFRIQDSPVQTIDQLLEALQTGMEDLFLQLLEEILQAFSHDSIVQAQIGFWAVGQLEYYDLDGNHLMELLTHCLGKQEASRIVALGLKSLDLENSLLLWMQFLVYWQQGPGVKDPAYPELWQHFLSWKTEVVEFQGQMGKDKDFEEAFSILENQLEHPQSQHEPEIPSIRAQYPRVGQTQAKQLDLFAS